MPICLWTHQPFQRQHEPFKRKRQPFQQQYNPFERRNQPFERRNQPFEWLLNARNFSAELWFEPLSQVDQTAAIVTETIQTKTLNRSKKTNYCKNRKVLAECFKA